MPLEYSNNIPSMFARVYTAPPQEVFFDMYENDTSFDDAARNLYDKEMESDYGTDLFDEFLAESVGAMGGLDDDAVEKAIYQTNIAQEQGIDPSAITTPYGPGLTQDEIDQVIDEFPGINVGIEWRNMDEQFQGAERLIGDEDTSASIDAMMDEAVRKAEDEGGIDSLGDIFKAVGDQIGNAVGSIIQTVTPQTAYAEELTTDSQDTATDVPTDVWLSELLNSGTVKNTSDAIKANFSTGAINNAPNTDGYPQIREAPEDPMAEAAKKFESLLAGGTTLERLLENIRQVPDTDFVDYWMNQPGWAERVRDAGVDPEQFRIEFRGESSVTDEPTDELPSVSDKKAKDFARITESEIERRNRDMMTRSFYETIYAQPWGGRAEFSSMLPTMLSETKTLFSIKLGMEHGKLGWKGVDSVYSFTPSKQERDKPSELRNDYKDFLSDYIQNPNKYRSGEWLRSKTNIINDLLTKASDPDTYGTIDTWNDTDTKNWFWVQPLFSDVGNLSKSTASTNRLNLMNMMATSGIQDRYFASAMESGVSSAIKQYRNLGYSDQDIFSRMTKMFSGAKDEVQPDLWLGDVAAKAGDVAAKAAADADSEERKAREQQSTKASRTPEIYGGLDPRLSYAGEPTELDRDIDRILSRSSGMQVASPRNALIQNRMEFHDETLNEATDWVDESMKTFPGQPDPSFLPGAERYAQFGVDPSLSRSDIGDILTDFDLAADIRKPPMRRMGLSPAELDQMMIDFGM